MRSVAAAALIGFVLTAAFPAHAANVALTFDDLPIFGHWSSAAEGAPITKKLLGSLKRHHFVATGFVNEMQLEAPDKPARIALLQAWLDAGMDLGNHSYSHLSLNDTPLDAYIADVARGGDVTRKLLAARGWTERWYRYPYLETGPTIAAKAGFEQWLAAHGYRIAPVTMENSDWQFDPSYVDALAHGDRRAARLVRKAYIAYTRAIIGWYRTASVALLGREIDFVCLLHASRLNADSIGALAGVLSHNHLRVVPLDAAMKDPAYRLRDAYVGPDGNGWLERWSQTLHRDLPYASLPKVPAEIVAAADAFAALTGRDRG